MSDCVFCAIARGDIPTTVVFEDERVIAFEDASPQSPVHVLVIPKQHYENLGDDVSGEDLAAIFRAVPQVACIKGVQDSGYRVIVNNGRDANQTVHHLHVHVMGGRRMTHGMARFAGE